MMEHEELECASRHSMRVLKKSACRVGQSLFLLALAPSLLVRASSTEVLLIHQHGSYGIHLHATTLDDLEFGAAGSIQYGHRGQCYCGPLNPNAAEPIAVIVGIPPAEVRINASDAKAFGTGDLGSSPSWARILLGKETLNFCSFVCSNGAFSARFTDRAILGILLTNHALLL